MLSVIDAALGRTRTVLSILVFILIAGSVAYVDIPKESDPDINIPIIYVTVKHDGISPEDAERLIIRPLEQEMRTIEGIKEMRSTGYEGGANVLWNLKPGSTLTRRWTTCAKKSISPRRSFRANLKSQKSMR